MALRARPKMKEPRQRLTTARKIQLLRENSVKTTDLPVGFWTIAKLRDSARYCMNDWAPGTGAPAANVRFWPFSDFTGRLTLVRNALQSGRRSTRVYRLSICEYMP
jgi:hypothetical protein